MPVEGRREPGHDPVRAELRPAAPRRRSRPSGCARPRRPRAGGRPPRRSCRWAQPPAMRPSTQIVGPTLPVLSNTCDRCSPRYQSRSFHPIGVGSRPGRSADPRLGVGDRLRVAGQHERRRAVDLHGLGVERGHGRSGRAHRPPGPPLHVGQRARTEAIEPAADQLGPRLLHRDRGQRGAEPGLEGRPSVLAARPSSLGSAPHEQPLHAHQVQHSGGQPGGRLVLGAGGQRDACRQLGDDLGEVGRLRLRRPPPPRPASWPPSWPTSGRDRRSPRAAPAGRGASCARWRRPRPRWIAGARPHRRPRR